MPKIVNTTTNIPRHVAIIMDGNGRWAQQRFMPRTAGHAKGAAGVRRVVERCSQRGVKYLTLFAFSTENWQRPADEVGALMGLFLQYIKREVTSLANAGVRLKVIGDVSAFGAELQQCIHAAEVATQDNDLITLCVAANYGGRWDVLQAVKNWQAANPAAPLAEINEPDLAAHLSTADMPEVDLLIRTGGEQRISNFLLWQSAYAELYFTDVLWPEFGDKELDQAIEWYGKRTRRLGKTTEQLLGEPVRRIA